ncbi:MAG TPA: acyl-CoA thioesterase domain-containing protein [Ramlibacter sp.]|nr:acyl-CoA thioesterase domain-containing protein [Ramlibacter sp.]
MEALLATLQLEQRDPLTWIGRTPASGTLAIYGGQLLAQALVAMARTVPEGLAIHSLHAHFLRAGDIAQDVVYSVTPALDSRRFAARHVVAQQGGPAIFMASASFHAPEGTHQRFAPQPPVPAPAALESETGFLRRIAWDERQGRVRASFFTALWERRSASWRHPLARGGDAPRAGIWWRLRAPPPEDPVLQQALVAYACDLDLMFTAMRPRGFGAAEPGAQAVSLNHAMWFHRPLRPHAWFYYDLDSPFAAHNRGLGRGAIYQDGLLAATVLQEGLFRVPAPEPAYTEQET